MKTTTRSSSFFDSKLIEENVFWKQYVKLVEDQNQEKSFKRSEKDDFEEDRSNTLFKFLKAALRTLLRWIRKIFELIVALFLWFFETKNISEASTPSDIRERDQRSKEIREYWRFQMSKMKKHSFNLSLFCVLASILSLHSLLNGNSFLYNATYLPVELASNIPTAHLSIFYAIWAVFNVLFLFYFSLVVYVPAGWCQTIGLNLFEAWGSLTTIIVMSKCFMIIRNVANFIAYQGNSDCCYGLIGIANENSIGIALVVQSFTDMYHAYAYSILPFRYSTFLLFNILQLLEVLIRLLTCQAVLADIPLRKQLIGTFVIGIVSYFAHVSLVPLATEIGLKNTFLHLEKQQKLLEENSSFVTILCEDVKLSALQHRKILGELSYHLKVKWWEYVERDYHQLMGLSDAMNTFVDDLVFIMKVQEKRFSFSMQDDVSLPVLVDSILQIKYGETKEDLLWRKEKFLIRLPEEFLRSNRNCLRILLLYSVVTAMELLNQQYDRSDPNFPKVSISCDLQPIDSQKQWSWLDFSLTWSMDCALQHLHRINEHSYLLKISDSDYLIESSAIVCDKIVQTYQGKWLLTSNGIHFTCPYQSLAQQPVTNTFFARKNEKELSQFQNFLINEACVILNDLRVESLVLDAISQLPGGREIPIIRDSMHTLHVLRNSIVFIQSLSVLPRLTELKYDGTVILLSERLAYLDDSELQQSHRIDYTCPLPWNEEMILSLKFFLFDLWERQKKIHHSVGEAAAKRVNAGDLYAPEVDPLREGSVLSQVWSSLKESIKPPPAFSSLPSSKKKRLNREQEENLARKQRVNELQESYYRWKFLSPTSFLISRAIVMDLFIAVHEVTIAVLCIFGSLPLSYGLVQLFSLLLLGTRTALYEAFFRKRKSPFAILWKCFIAVRFFSEILVTGLEFFRFNTPGKPPINILTKDFTSLEEYLTSSYGLLTGFFTIFNLMNSTSHLRYTGELFPRPYTKWMIITIIIHTVLVLIYFQYQRFFSMTVIAVLLVFFVFSLIIWMIYQSFSVHSVEAEFLLLYDRVLANDMFQRCSTFSKYFLVSRLQAYDQIEQRLLTTIQRACSDLYLTENREREPINQQSYLYHLHSSTTNTANSNLDALAKKGIAAMINNPEHQEKIIHALLQELYDYHIPKYLQLSPAMIETLHRLQHAKRMMAQMCYSLQVVTTRDRRESINMGKAIENQTLKSNILIQFKAMMIRSLVDDLIRSFIHGGYKTVIRYYVHIHPSVAVIRINKQLFQTTLSDLLLQALERIEQTVEYFAKHPTHERSKQYAENAAIGQEILIWIQPTETKHRIIPFSDVRQLQITVLDTGVILPLQGRALAISEHNPDGTSILFDPLLEVDNKSLSDKVKKPSKLMKGKFSQVLPQPNSTSKLSSTSKPNEETKATVGKNPSSNADNNKSNSSTPGLFACRSSVVQFEYHRLSDQFLQYFDLPNRSEFGHLYHSQYRSYQKVALPMVLSIRSRECELIVAMYVLSSSPATMVYKSEPIAPKIYYQYSIEMEMPLLQHLQLEITESTHLTTIEGGSSSSGGGKGMDNESPLDHNISKTNKKTSNKIKDDVALITEPAVYHTHRVKGVKLLPASLPELIRKQIIDYRLFLLQQEKQSKQYIEKLLVILSSMVLHTAIDMERLAAQDRQNSRSGGGKGSHHHHHSHHRVGGGGKALLPPTKNYRPSLLHSSQQNQPPIPAFTIYNSSRVNNPLRKGKVTIYCMQSEETSQKNNIVQYMFKTRYWHSQTIYLDGYPKVSSFLDSDIVIIEHSPRYVRYKDEKYRREVSDNHSVSSSSGNSHHPYGEEDDHDSYHPFKYYYRLEMSYRIPSLIHYLRLNGFMGLIVIVYQSPQKKVALERQAMQLEYPVEIHPDCEEVTNLNLLQHPNEYTDAVAADVHLTLPWKEEVVDDILFAWKQRVVTSIFTELKN